MVVHPLVTAKIPFRLIEHEFTGIKYSCLCGNKRLSIVAWLVPRHCFEKVIDASKNSRIVTSSVLWPQEFRSCNKNSRICTGERIFKFLISVRKMLSVVEIKANVAYFYFLRGLLYLLRILPTTYSKYILIRCAQFWKNFWFFEKIFEFSKKYFILVQKRWSEHYHLSGLEFCQF